MAVESWETFGIKTDRDKKSERLSLIRTKRQRAGVLRCHLNTGQQQLESVSNSSALHTASPSGEHSASRTLLESYAVSHTPTDQPVCEHMCVCAWMWEWLGAPRFSLLNLCNVFAFLAHHIRDVFPLLAYRKGKDLTSVLNALAHITFSIWTSAQVSSKSTE